MKKFWFITILAIFVFYSCREDELVVPTEYDIINDPPLPNSKVRGFYLVNEAKHGKQQMHLGLL